MGRLLLGGGFVIFRGVVSRGHGRSLVTFIGNYGRIGLKIFVWVGYGVYMVNIQWGGHRGHERSMVTNLVVY